MITYRPFYETLKRKNISTYTLINTFGVSRSLLDRLKHDKPITTVTLNDLCTILNCAIKNILEYVRFKGQDVKDEEEFTLVMNNYRASGAGGFEFYTECEVVKEIQVEMTEIIINYFNRHTNIVVDKNKYINVMK